MQKRIIISIFLFWLCFLYGCETDWSGSDYFNTLGTSLNVTGYWKGHEYGETAYWDFEMNLTQTGNNVSGVYAKGTCYSPSTRRCCVIALSGTYNPVTGKLTLQLSDRSNLVVFDAIIRQGTETGTVNDWLDAEDISLLRWSNTPTDDFPSYGCGR